mgnify:CR=1 FL=1
MQLITKKMEVPFRGPSSSKVFNEFIENIYYDLVQLFKTAQKHSIQIARDSEELLRENLFLQQKIAELEDQLQTIQGSMANGTPENPNFLIQSLTDDTCVVSTTNIKHNSLFGVAHQDIKQKISKLNLRDLNGDVMVPKSLKVEVYESTSPINITDNNISQSLLVQNDSILNAFDDNPSTCWQQASMMPGSVEQVYALIHIEVPQNIVNHMRANMLVLEPSPEFGQSIMDIQYKTTTQWHRLPEYPTENIGGNIKPVEFTRSTKEMFVFPHRDIVALRILIRQPHPIEIGNQRLFTYGFRNIGLYYTRFEEVQTGTIRIKIKHPQAHTKSFYKIYSAEPIFKKGGIKEVQDIKLYIDESGPPQEFGDFVLPSASQEEVYIEVDLACDATGASPLLSGIKLNYSSI